MKFLPIFLAGLYLATVQWALGIRPEHLALVGFVLTAYYLGEKSRRLVLDLLPFASFAALYDFLRIYPKAWAGPIHVVGPYRLEAALFGFIWNGEKIIPTEFFRTHTHPLLDLAAAVAYSLHIVVPLAFLLYARVKDPLLARRFAWAFLAANLIAFVLYVTLPVAPPWYVEQHGMASGDWSAAGSAAGLTGFDRLIGIPYFQTFYAKSAWVFGAVPSMHAGFPVLVILYAGRILKKGLIPLYVFLVLVWFSAVYLRHHYVIDLLAGALTALATFGGLSLFYQKTPREHKGAHQGHDREP